MNEEYSNIPLLQLIAIGDNKIKLTETSKWALCYGKNPRSFGRLDSALCPPTQKENHLFTCPLGVAVNYREGVGKFRPAFQKKFVSLPAQQLQLLPPQPLPLLECEKKTLQNPPLISQPPPPP